VDVVYDGVGRNTFEKSLRCLKSRGLLALYGASSGSVPPFDLGRLAQMGSLYITGPISTDYVNSAGKLLLSVGGEHGANDNQESYSKRTS
jgi:NADPH2:quinone reductase